MDDGACALLWGLISGWLGILLEDELLASCGLGAVVRSVLRGAESWL